MGDEDDKETARSIAKAQGLQFHCIPTERCGALNVYVQGDIEGLQKSFNPLGKHLTTCTNKYKIVNAIYFQNSP